jgi:glyoxylase-like metal-dependent hydrolase (beta-lactamase superfamily II)
MFVMIESLRIGPEKNFTYLISCSKTHKAVLVDAAFDQSRVAEWSKSKNVEFLLATHGHWDHSEGLLQMQKLLPQAQIACHELDEYRLTKFGCKNIVVLTDKQILKLGDTVEIHVLHTPGHTEGGTCYLVKENDQEIALLTGDTLFIDQCGRTDLPGGNEKDLFNSLQKIKLLPPHLQIYPGHDYGPKPTATLKEQFQTNSVLRVNTFDEFKLIP